MFLVEDIKMMMILLKKAKIITNSRIHDNDNDNHFQL
jgi:hypothetical protein